MSDIGAETTTLLENRDAAQTSIMRSVERDGQPEQSEANLVKDIVNKIKTWEKHWEKVFDQMKADVRFASNKNGAQWGGTKAAPAIDEYVANITFRHIQGRTGLLYAKNPRVKAGRRKRIDHKIWDGTAQQIKQAMAALAAAQQAVSGQPTVVPGATPGAPPTVAPPPPMPPLIDVAGAKAVLEDAQRVRQRRAIIDKIGKTAEVLYTYYQGEGNPAFKKRAKGWVRRTVTTGVGWLKLDFERVREYTPTVAGEIDQLTTELNHLKSELAKIADGETVDGSARIAEIEAQLQKFAADPTVNVREGLLFGFPKSWRVIPDMDCSQLSTLTDCWELAECMPMTADQIRENYGVNVGQNYTKYKGKDEKTNRDRTEAMVYEHYNRRTGLMCVVCEGYPAFLVKPQAPRVRVKRFFPYYPLCFNELECEEGEIFPPSDVQLIAHQQKEYNRARESLRQHRIASQPGHVANKAAFSNEDDVRAMKNRRPHEVTMLEGLGDKKVSDVLQAIPLNTIDPNVYETNMVFTDVQRTTGDQAANLGGTSGDTATEVATAENSRLSTVSSNADDLDMVLSEVARDGCHVMLTEVSQEAAMRIAGEGAVWPQTTGEDYSAEIYLEVVAGSSGRPNRDRDAAIVERLFPLAVQTGDIRPGYLAKTVVQLMDEAVDLEDAILDGLPSILALNELAKGALPGPAAGGGMPGSDTPTGDPATDPNQQDGAAPAPAVGGGGPGASFPGGVAPASPGM